MSSIFWGDFPRLLESEKYADVAKRCLMGS